MCKVSVIIPSYNHGRFLDERFRSILSQTYDDYEILFLDDCSTDNSLQVFEKYRGHPKVRSFINTTNSGSTFKQWNKGVRSARGEYIWFAESDDAAEPEFLETLASILDRRPKVGLAYTNSIYIDEGGKTGTTLDLNYLDLHPTRWKHDYINRGTDECLNYLIFKNSVPNASAVLFRKALYEKTGYADERMKRGGDWWVWVNLLLVSDVAYVAAPLNRFRKEHAQCTRVMQNHHVAFEEMLQIIGLIASRLGFPPGGEDAICRSCIGAYKWLAGMTGGDGPRVTARMLQLACDISPQLFFAMAAVARQRAERLPRHEYGGPRVTEVSRPAIRLTNARRTALVLIPGVVNYFYNLNGRRIAEALRDLGFEVDVRTLAPSITGEYDWCVLAAPTEVLHGTGNYDAALETMAAIRRRCNLLASSSLEAARTPWFEKIWRCCESLGVDAMLDFGFHDQREDLAPEVRKKYHFIMAGLTTSELTALDDEYFDDGRRTIPWTFVGHISPERVGMINRLVRTADPRGFVYIPQLTTPCKEKDSHHLNQHQFDAVLRRSRYQVWCSHHTHFYVESERFRMSLLAGGVPIKVIAGRPATADSLPFGYLMMDQESVAQQLADANFEDLRHRFRDDYRRLKSMTAGLAEYLAAADLLDSSDIGDDITGRSEVLYAA
jgi:hypothetical protein